MSATAAQLQPAEISAGQRIGRIPLPVVVLAAATALLCGAVICAEPYLPSSWRSPALLTWFAAALLAATSCMQLAMSAPLRRDRGRWFGLALSSTLTGLAALLLRSEPELASFTGATVGLVALAISIVAAASAMVVHRLWRERRPAQITLASDILLPAMVISFASLLPATGLTPGRVSWLSWAAICAILVGQTTLAVAAWFSLPRTPTDPAAWGLAAGSSAGILGTTTLTIAWASGSADWIAPAALLFAVGHGTLVAGTLMRVRTGERQVGGVASWGTLPRHATLSLLPMLLSLMAIAATIEVRTAPVPPVGLPALVIAAALVFAARLLASLVAHERALRDARRRQIDLLNRANLDALTELPNRAALDQRLAEESERARRYGQPLSVCFIDIDHFKQVNDNYGHDRGDEVLRQVARVMRQTARTIDVVGRYGGEEFLVIAPATSSEDAITLGDRLRVAVARVTADPEMGSVPVTISVGIAGMPEHAATREELMRRADIALYEAKATGRNRVRLAEVR